MTTSNKYNSKDCWDKAKIIAEIIAIIAIIYFGQAVNASIKSRELDLKYVHLAVGILQTKPNNTVGGLREWAADIIDSHSKIPLSEKAKKELLDYKLPFTWDNTSWDDNTYWKK